MTQTETAARGLYKEYEPRPVWIAHLVALGGLIALLCVLNRGIIAAAIRVWWVSPTYSHCFVIIPISAYLIWRRRRVLAAMTPCVFPRALLLALPLIGVLLLGALADINEVRQLAFMGLVQVLAVSVLGLQVYRKILFPSLFLFFLVPMGEYLITPLQLFTAQFVSAGLTLIGVLHHTEGNVIDLVNGRFEVAEACAGLRFLIATIAVGVLFAHFTYRKWYKIALYLLASVIVPVIGNGLRALGIVLLAYWSDNRIAHGADHIIYGWGFSVAILCFLMFVGMRFADELPADDPAADAPFRPQSFALTLIAAVLAISAVPALLYWRDHVPVAFDKTALSAPDFPAGFSLAKPSQDWKPVYAAPDARLAIAIRNGAPFTPPVDVVVDYYAKSSDGHTLISSTNKLWDENVWHPVSQGSVRAMLGRQPLQLGQLEIASAGTSRLVWWTYWSNGQFTTSGIRVKLDRLGTAFTGRDGSALIAVSTTINVDEDDARARLRQALSALGGLQDRLRATARLPAAHRQAG